MDKFEQQFEDLDVATGYYEGTTNAATATDTPQEEVDRLMGQIADEAQIDLKQDLSATAAAPVTIKTGPTEVEEDGYNFPPGVLLANEIY